MQVGLHNGCKMVVVVVSTFIVSSLVLGYKYRGAVINDTIPFPLAFKDQESTLPVTDFP